MNTIEAIKKNNLIFITSQPDTPYFHWQVKLYLHNFTKYGIKDHCYALFGYRDQPSQTIKDLSKKYNIRWYKDTHEQRTYVPNIRPLLLKKFFKENPELGKNVFYHDSDILFTKLPKFELLLGDDTCYLSDTVSYIGYKYIRDKCREYKKIYDSLGDDDLFLKMCDIVNINPQIVKDNNYVSGGAQCLLKNIDYNYWDQCEKDNKNLYDFLCKYCIEYKMEHEIQKWTASMWGELWNLWKLKKETKLNIELDFTQATDHIETCKICNILHMNGVTDKNNHNHFHKYKYHDKDIFQEYLKDKTIFDHVDPNNASYYYVKEIKDYASNIQSGGKRRKKKKTKKKKRKN